MSFALLNFFLFRLSRQIPSQAAAAQVSRYSNAADALAALVDAAASAPQMDVAKVKEGKHNNSSSRDDDMMTSRRAAQESQEVERRSVQSPYGDVSLSSGKPSHPVYAEGGGAAGSKEKAPPTKSRMEEELRTHGKTTITAANFIDVIITRQIAPDKDPRERGSQSSDSSSSSECHQIDSLYFLFLDMLSNNNDDQFTNNRGCITLYSS